MNTIKCRIKLNEYQDVAGVGITPAEAVLLRTLHAPADAMLAKGTSDKEESLALWKFITNPVGTGKAMTETPDPEDPDKTVKTDRTNAEECARLRMKYPVRAKSGGHGTHILDDLYPGLSPELPQTFVQIGLAVAPPGTVFKAAKGDDPQLATKTDDKPAATDAKAAKAAKAAKED